MQEIEPENKILSFILKTLQIIILVFGILWGVLNTASIFLPYEQLIAVFSYIIPLEETEISETAYRPPEEDTVLDQFFEASFFPFFVFSNLSVIGGIFILYNGRTLLEMVYLFDGFFIPRQRKYWGTIFDLESNTPVSLASINLILDQDSGKKIIASTVSDLDGRYRLRIPATKGNFYIEVKATNYVPLRKDIGETAKLLVNQGELIEDIPLTKLGDAPNTLASRFYDLRVKLYPILIFYLLVLSIANFLIYLYPATTNPALDTMFGAGFFGIAVVWNLAIVTERIRNKGGKIQDEKHAPISGATVRIFKDGRQLNSVLSNTEGFVKFEVNPGEYEVIVDKPGFELQNADNKFLKVKVTNDGYLNRNITLRKVSSDINSVNTALLSNPFEN
jgi:hypothetical protein